MKQIIWSSDALLDETAREYYQNFKREELDDDAYKVSDEEWSDEVYNELGDERQNLNKDVNGVIIAFGDLGLWNGRKQGYQILGDNIAGILQSTQYDAEWYGDGYPKLYPAALCRSDTDIWLLESLPIKSSRFCSGG